MEQRKQAAGTIALEAVDRFLTEIANGDSGGEQAATCFAKHLSHLSSGGLPAAAQDTWRQVSRVLRTPADKPIPEKVTLAMRSWPQSRVAELISHIRDLHAILEKVENDRLEDEIRDSIRHHYL